MEKIKLIIGSQVPHISQIITGFLMLKDRGYQLEFEYIPNDGSTLAIMPAIRAEYRGQHLMYDVGDGYNVPESIVAGAEISDFYFKRSFSAERNREIVPQYLDKMYPLGFNYHVTCKGNPVGAVFGLVFCLNIGIFHPLACKRSPVNGFYCVLQNILRLNIMHRHLPALWRIHLRRVWW